MNYVYGMRNAMRNNIYLQYNHNITVNLLQYDLEYVYNQFYINLVNIN